VINGYMEQNLFALATSVIMLKVNSTYMPCHCITKACHGVNIGNTYITEKASKSFAELAEALQMKVVTQLKKCKFFSILLDGSTSDSWFKN